MSVKMYIVLLLAALAMPTFCFAQAQQENDASAKSTFIAAPFPRRLPPPPGDGWVWIPPTYRTVYGRVWTEPVYQTVTETVWAPEQYGWRTVCYWENGQYVQRQEWVLISPGHFERRSHQVMISPGGWTWGPRLEVVTPGHWEWRGTTPPPPPVAPTPFTPAPRPPGLEPFSPLWEWPAGSEKK